MTNYYTDLAISNFLSLPAKLNEQELTEFLTLQQNHLKGRIKVVFDNCNPEFVQSIIQKVFPVSKIKPYNSNFFVLNRQESVNFLNKDTLIDFEILEVRSNDKENIDVIKNLLTSSFAIKISKDELGKTIFDENPQRVIEILSNFDKSYKQKGLKTFLVKSKQGEIVGCYSLIQVNKEVQLSGVAGRTTLNNCFKGKKLLILCQAMISSFLKEKSFEKLEFLTLSNSKVPVANIYQDLGIPKNFNRKGLLLQID